MNSVILPLLLLVGAASCHHSHHGWKPGHRYQYEMRGRNVAGLHQAADQFVGLLTRGVVNVQPKSDGRVNVQIQQPEQLDIHQRLARGWKTFIPDEGSDYKPLPLVSQSFDLEFEGGLVKKMWVHPEVPTYEANIFKAIASLLQIDTTGKNLKKSSFNQNSQSNEQLATFKTTEDSVHGEVETSYSLSPLPAYHLIKYPITARMAGACPHKNTFSVQKTLNFDNARHLPEYHYGFADLPEGVVGGNRMGDMLSRSVNTWAVVCGALDNFLVQSSVSTDRVFVAPHLYNDQKGVVVSEFNLTLTNVDDSQQEPQGLPADSREYESLIYDYNDAAANQNSERKTRGKREINNKHDYSAPKVNHQNEITSHKSKNTTSFSSGNSAEDSSSSSSSSDSDSSNSRGESMPSKEAFLQPRPELKSAPNNPLLPYFIAVKGNSIQASPKLNGLEKTETLANSIGRDMVELSSVAHQQTLSKFTRLVSLLQTMNEEQMSKATEKLYFSLAKASSKSSDDATRYNAWIAFRDATVQAGTGPALLTLRSWINSCKVSGEEAAELVATVSRMAHYPCEEFIQYFYNMMVSDDVSKFQHVNTSAIISFAGLVRRALVSNDTARQRYPVHSFGRPHSRNSTLVGQKFVPYFHEKLAESIQQGDSAKIQVYIWALGLMSHPQVIPIFEPYLNRTKSVSHFQRLTMIVSLNEMTRVYPKLVRPLMFKIYQNTEEKPEIRVAAVMQMMKTNPPAQILQRMSEFTNYEKSKQVNSAVKSALESAARDIYRHGNQHLSENARSAVGSLTNYEYGSQYSKILLSSGGKKNIDLSYEHELAHIESGDSVIPSSIFCSIKRQLGGFQNHPSKTFFSTSSIANMWALISSHVGGRSSNKANNPASQIWNYDAIANRLNLQLETEAQVEGNIMTSLLGSERLFTFDNHTINQLPEFVKTVVNNARSPKHFNMTKIFDQLKLKIAFPTALGLPFSYSFNVPTVVALRGQVHGKLHPDPTRREGQIPFPKTVNVTADLNMMYSALSESKMGFVTPFNQKEYIAGLKRQIQLHLPLRLDADLDLENSKLWWDAQPLNPKASSKLFEFSTVPYTAIQNILDILSPTINNEIVNVRKTEKVHTTIGEDLMGLAFDVKLDTQQKSLSWSNVYEAVKQHNFMTAMLYPMAEEAINYNNFSLTYNGAKSQTSSVRGVVKYITWNSESGAPQPISNQSSIKEFDASFDSQLRESQMLKKASEGVPNATSNLLDLSIAFKGPNSETVVAAAAALGSSRVHKRSQMIAFSSFGDKATAYKILGELNATSPLQHVINYVKTLHEESKIDVEGKLNFGRKDDMAAIKLNVNMMKSEERRHALESNPMTEVCKKQMSKKQLVQPACRNVTGRSGHMDVYDADIYYKNVPVGVRKASYILYTISRYYMTDYMSEQLAKQKDSSEDSGHILANVRLSSTSKTFNASIVSPAINVEFTRVPVNPFVTWQAINVHPKYSVVSRVASKLTRNQYFPICVVEKNVVNTFDNLTYPASLGGCWYTMAHSFPKTMEGLKYPLHSSNFSIHVRTKDSDSGNEKEVMMILDNNVINLHLSKNRPALSWNNQSASVSEGRVSRFWDSNQNEVAAAYVVPGDLLVVESVQYNLQLMYDGSRVILQISNAMRGSVRGLCGNFNGEKIDDLMVPKNCIVQNPLMFPSEYISDSCNQNRSKSKADNTEQCSYVNE